MLQRGSHDKVLDHQITAKEPDELIGVAILRAGVGEPAIGALDDGVVILDGF